MEKNKINISKFEDASVYKNQDIAFNYLATSFPFFHTHEYFELLIITEGAFKHIINGETIIAKEGDCFFIRPNDNHAIFSIDDAKSSKNINIVIRTPYIKSVLDTYGENVYNDVINAKTLKSVSINIYEIIEIRNTLVNYELMNSPVKEVVLHLKLIVNMYISKILFHNFESKSKTLKILSDLLFYLKDPNITANEIHNLVNKTPYSYSQLSRIFKKETGKTIIEYVTYFKMNSAKIMLSSTQMSIIDISTELNYKSISHFNRTFKKYINLTPKEYRKNNQ